MDIATLIGLVVGIGVVVGAILIGSGLDLFLNLPGFLIVVGGTLAATFVKFPLQNVFRAFKIGASSALRNVYEDPRDLIQISLELAEKARKNGVLALEGANVANPFFQRGIRLCVDGHPLAVIQSALLRDMELSIHRHEEGARIFKAIGDSAPAFGMIGTLVGLVQMLADMENPASIGPAMAVALLTTLYGAVIANLVALPVADKLETKVEEERLTKELILEAITQIHGRQSPMVMADILEGFLPENQRPSENDDEEPAGSVEPGEQP
ncbi:MAG: MotA/TolQ/ExbB proton channel family protein [Alphaproteobacteria bacterium]|nr:MotA/TolQ/ExbB proton channel family protein [Alphaproteobacteria bacterium]